jgi:hypothetical protein
MRVLAALSSMIVVAGCSDSPKDSQTITINTPDGNLVTTATPVDPEPQKISPVTGETLKSLQGAESETRDFLATYLVFEGEPTLKDYDRAFRAWQTSASPKHTPQQVIDLVGRYFGNKCVAELNMEWVTVTDSHGTDYAVRSKTSEVMTFPFSAVAKRIEQQEFDFLDPIFNSAKQMIESGEYMPREQPSTSEAQP